MKKGSMKLVKILAVMFLLTFVSGCAGNQKAAESSAAAETREVKTEANKAAEGKKVYFAGPLFNHAEKDFNRKVVEILEENGYQVFLPQRDGIEAALLEGKSEEELTRMIFDLDSGEVEKADIIFMNLDGRVPDEGACVELGIAFGKGKRCYGFKTDTRSMELGLDLNPMISGCMNRIFKNTDGDALLEEIRKYLAENNL